MDNSFSKKDIEIRLTIRRGDFSAVGNQKIINGLATSVTVVKTCLPAKNSANVTIYGLLTEDMEPLTTLAFKPLDFYKNTIEIWAGDLNNKQCIFTGDIFNATADFNSQPNIAFNIEAVTNWFASATPKAVYSYKNQIPAKEIFKRLSEDMQKTFIDGGGVDGSVKNIALAGDPFQKANSLRAQLGCQLILDDETMWVAGADQVRGENIPVWSVETGLRGYPVFTQRGITATHLFDSTVLSGGRVKLKTIVPKASGIWRIYQIKHTLEAYKPGGKWETTVDCLYRQGE